MVRLLRAMPELLILLILIAEAATGHEQGNSS